jgi:hypothetical protein
MTLRIRWSRSVFIVPLLLVATRKASAETTNFRVQGNTVTALPEAGRSSRPLFGKLRLCRASDLVDKVLPGGRTPDAGTLLQVNKTDICCDVVLFEGGGRVSSLPDCNKDASHNNCYGSDSRGSFYMHCRT